MSLRSPLRFFLAVGFVVAMSGPLFAEPKYESAKLTPSPGVDWENKSHESIDSLVIAKDASIRLRNCSDITIVACDLHSIELIECTNIKIRNCYVHDSALVGVQMYKGKDVVVQGCRLESVASGVYAIESEGIKVLGNFGRNMVGPFPRGQMAQFDKLTGAGSAISGNYVINESGKSHPEDAINLYQSTGTKDSPIVVENNYLTGDPVRGSNGKSATGSGIMLGDCGGGYQVCRNNVVINAGQVGIGVAGGDDIRVENNQILIEKSDVSNVGLYVWNQSKKPSSRAIFIGNRIRCVNKKGEAESWWDGGGVKDVVQKENQFDDLKLASSLPAPPSAAPTPPGLWMDKGAGDLALVRIPWR